MGLRSKIFNGLFGRSKAILDAQKDLTLKLINAPELNCHELFSTHLTEEESIEIHVKRIARFGYSERCRPKGVSRLEYLKSLSGFPEKNCHQAFHVEINLTSRESVAIHEYRMICHKSSVRLGPNEVRQSLKRISLLLEDPSINCHEGWHSSVNISTKQSLDIHRQRQERYGQSFRSDMFKTLEDKERQEKLEKERKKSERISLLLEDPSINCHEGWHSSVNISTKESLDIHRQRQERYGQSFRSVMFKTLEDKEREEIEKERKKSERIALLLEDPSINCHEGWHSSVNISTKESLDIHRRRQERYAQSFRSDAFKSKMCKSQAEEAAVRWKSENLEIVESFSKGLYLEIEALKKTDSYGIEDFSGWECEYLEHWEIDLVISKVTGSKYKFFKRKDGLAYFFEKIIASKMGGIETWFNDWTRFKDILEDGAWQNASWREFLWDMTYNVYRGYQIDDQLDRLQGGGVGDRGHVYFIRNADLYKIGITKDLNRRLKELQPDEVLHAMKSRCYRRIEKRLHGLFGDVRVPGSEYFRLDENQVSQVIELMVEFSD